MSICHEDLLGKNLLTVQSVLSKKVGHVKSVGKMLNNLGIKTFNCSETVFLGMIRAYVF